MDDITRARILKRMLDAGGIRRIAGQLLAEVAEPDGRWDGVDGVLASFSERDALHHSTELLRIASEDADAFVDSTATVSMIDATLDSYAVHDAGPLVAWFVAHGDELDR